GGGGGGVAPECGERAFFDQPREILLDGLPPLLDQLRRSLRDDHPTTRLRRHLRDARAHQAAAHHAHLLNRHMNSPSRESWIEAFPQRAYPAASTIIATPCSVFAPE